MSSLLGVGFEKVRSQDLVTLNPRHRPGGSQTTRPPVAAERYRVWLTDRIAEYAGGVNMPHTVVIKIEEDSKGLFEIEGTWSYNGVTFKL
jgi:hypothetical protein